MKIGGKSKRQSKSMTDGLTRLKSLKVEPSLIQKIMKEEKSECLIENLKDG